MQRPCQLIFELEEGRRRGHNKGDFFGGSMNPVQYILVAAFVALAVIWPISFFGYKFYEELTHVKDSAKH
jgi:hypothetical protein